MDKVVKDRKKKKTYMWRLNPDKPDYKFKSGTPIVNEIKKAYRRKI